MKLTHDYTLNFKIILLILLSEQRCRKIKNSETNLLELKI